MHPAAPVEPATATTRTRAARRSRRSTARLRAAVGTVVGTALLASATVAPAGAGLTGYGPVGPDPASQLGLSVPVLAAEVSGPAGSVVTAELGGTTVSLTRPAGYSAGSQVVSITDLTRDDVPASLLPPELLAGVEVVLGVGVGVRPVDTAGAGPGVQGRVIRSTGATATAVTGTRADALVLELVSPELVGATVVVVDEGTRTSVSPEDTLRLELDGPAAVFALQPLDAADAAAGAEATTAAVDEDQPDTVATTVDAAPAVAADADRGASAAVVGGVVLFLLGLVGAAFLVARSGGARRQARL